VTGNAKSDGSRSPSDPGTPVCVHCFTLIDPSTSYCAGCGSAVGQYTEYVPFVNIAWQASGYDRLRRSTWPAAGGVVARIVGVFATLLLAPILLLRFGFKQLGRREGDRQG
jgi:hypothetical protein